MAQSKARKKKAPKRVLALPDLEHAKTAVLNSLTSASGQRTYEYAIREFVSWYCSEPRLAFNRTVVLRYRIHLEQRGYAPATTNLRLAAVRRIAYEAADAGLLSPELAAGIRRVKGVRRIGVRLGNWLTPEQGRRLLECATPSSKEPRRRVDSRGGHHARPGVPCDQQGRPCLGKRHVGEGAVGCGVRCCRSRRHREAGPARPAAHMRPSLPSRGRRTRSDPVPSRPRLDPDNGALPRMQAEAPGCRERPIGNRTRRRLTRFTSRADASIRPGRLLESNLSRRESRRTLRLRLDVN